MTAFIKDMMFFHGLMRHEVRHYVKRLAPIADALVSLHSTQKELPLTEAIAKFMGVSLSTPFHFTAVLYESEIQTVLESIDDSLLPNTPVVMCERNHATVFIKRTLPDGGVCYVYYEWNAFNIEQQFDTLTELAAYIAKRGNPEEAMPATLDFDLRVLCSSTAFTPEAEVGEETKAESGTVSFPDPMAVYDRIISDRDSAAEPPCELRTRKGANSIKHAIESKNHAMLAGLLAAGADICAELCVGLKLTPLFSAIAALDLRMVTILVSHSRAAVTHSDAVFPLLYQALSDVPAGRMDEAEAIVHVLIDAGAQINHPYKPFFLMRCFDFGVSEELLLHLIERGAHPSEPNLDFKTPLHAAVLYGYPRVVAALLARGESCYDTDMGDFTPIDYAPMQADPERALTLLAVFAKYDELKSNFFLLSDRVKECVTLHPQVAAICQFSTISSETRSQRESRRLQFFSNFVRKDKGDAASKTCDDEAQEIKQGASSHVEPGPAAVTTSP